MITLAVELTGRLAVVVGGGPVAERKVAALLEAGARVRLISPALTPGLQSLREQGRIETQLRMYEPGDTAGALLTVATTGLPAVDEAVALEAAGQGRLVCVAGESDRGNAAFTAEIRRGPVSIAISTGGASPALARRLLRELEDAVRPAYGELAVILAEVREQIRNHSGRSQAERAALLKEIVQGPALDLLARGEGEAAGRLVAGAVSRWLEVNR